MVTIHTVPKDIADNVEKWVTGTKIPWFYFTHTLGNDLKGKREVNQDAYTLVDMPRLTHYFFPNSKSPQEDKRHVMPLIGWIKKELLPGYEVERVMGNLTTPLVGAGKFLNIPHTDSDNPNHVTFLYYVNDSDGKTLFFKDGSIHYQVEPLKGTGALFPSNTTHAGQIPVINKNRFVINIIFSKRD